MEAQTDLGLEVTTRKRLFEFGLGTWGAVLALAGLYMTCLVVANPLGEFPENDDFAYALTVKALVRDGRFQLTDWQSSTLVAQALWGALFCLPAGFSFTTLRLSTLVLSFGALFSTFRLFSTRGLGTKAGMVATLAITTNALWLGSSFSFMTDIPFYFLMVTSVFLLFAGLDKSRLELYLLGLAAGFVSLFVRQLGLGIFMALVVAAPFCVGFGRKWIFGAVLPAGAAYFALKFYDGFLIESGQAPYYYFAKHSHLGQVFVHLSKLRLGALRPFARRLPMCVTYIGFFLLPYTCLLAANTWRNLGKTAVATRMLAVGAVSLAGAFVLDRYSLRMPMLGNLLDDFGMGIRVLPGTFPTAPRPFWISLTAMGLFSGLLLLWWTGRGLWNSLRASNQASALLTRWQSVFLAVLFVVLIGPAMLMYGPFFDRYLVPLLPIVVLLSCQAIPRGALNLWENASRAAKGLSLACLLAIAAVSVAMVHDYMQWNQARWQAVAHARTNLDIEAEQLDGGFEVNNLEYYEKLLYVPGDHLTVQGVVGEDVAGARPYLVSVSRWASRPVLMRLPCHTWLPFSPRSIFLLGPADSTGNTAHAD